MDAQISGEPSVEHARTAKQSRIRNLVKAYNPALQVRSRLTWKSVACKGTDGRRGGNWKIDSLAQQSFPVEGGIVFYSLSFYKVSRIIASDK